MEKFKWVDRVEVEKETVVVPPDGWTNEMRIKYAQLLYHFLIDIVFRDEEEWVTIHKVLQGIGQDYLDANEEG